MIVGSVHHWSQPNRTVVYGTGFEVNRLSQGQYEIRIPQTFGASPILVATATGGMGAPADTEPIAVAGPVSDHVADEEYDWVWRMTFDEDDLVTDGFTFMATPSGTSRVINHGSAG